MSEEEDFNKAVKEYCKHVTDMTTADADDNMLDEWQATVLEEGESAAQPVSVPGRPVSVAGADSVKYTTEFDDPRDPDDDVAVLELRGLYAHSEVEVTGSRLDGVGPVEHDTYFQPLRIPFTPFEENELVVTCHAPRDRFGGIHDTDMVPDALSTPGIWWDVSLDTQPLPYIESIDVKPELSEDGAQLRLQTTVVADEMIDERITYSLRPAGDHQTRGMMERGAVETDGPGKTTVEHTVDVHDPALWWPRELGQQNRYELNAKLDGMEYSVTTGICEISADDGRLEVNGKSVPIRGVNLLTEDEADISRALDLNANLVRAHAHVLPERFYERCNEEGLLVWQDLPLTGPGSFDTGRAIELARILAREYGRHPSLAVYGVHDDPVDTFPDGLGSGFLDRLRLRWRAWRTNYDPEPARTVADEFVAERPVFPVVGGPGVDSDVGSYYPGWDYGDAKDIESLLQRYPASIVAEFGAGALATDTLDEIDDVAGFDLAKHDRCVTGGIEASQEYQAAVIRSIVEHLRTEDVGSVAFALRDIDQAGSGVYGQGGVEKAAVSALQQAYSPVQAFLSEPAPGEREIIVCNDTQHGLTADVGWRALSVDTTGDSDATADDDGKSEESIEAEGTFECTVGAAGRGTIGPFTIPSSADILRLEVVTEHINASNEYFL